MNSRTWKIRTAAHHKTAVIVALLAMLACTTDRTRRGYLERNAALFSSPPSRVAIVVPGFGVTRLYDPVTNRYVWGTPRSTVHTHFPEDMDLPAGGSDRLIPRGYVGSRGPVNVGWQLTEALRKYGGYTRDETVIPFAYDWRLSARDNAAKLGEVVNKVSRGSKVDIITHSAGAMVALTYVKLLGGGSRVEDLIMIAPTRRGVIDAFRVFVRPERFLRREFSPAMVATWPFIAELLPEDGRIVVDAEGHQTSFDAWDASSWDSILPAEARSAFADSLRRAQTLRDELRQTPMPPDIHVSVLAGDCVPTARRVLQRRDGTYVFYREELTPAEQSLASLLFEPGDGTVTVSSTRVDAEPSLFCDGHQGLASDPNVHRALVRILRDVVGFSVR